MCVIETTFFLCGHNVSKPMRRCSLTEYSPNFIPCSVIGNFHEYIKTSCVACSRVEWNQMILQREEEQKRNYELRSFYLSENPTNEDLRRSGHADTLEGKQRAGQMPPNDYHGGVSQNRQGTASANEEQLGGSNETRREMEIVADFIERTPLSQFGYGPQTRIEVIADLIERGPFSHPVYDQHTGIEIVADIIERGPLFQVSNQPTVDTSTHQALRQRESPVIIQWGDMEPVPYYPYQHATAAVRSEYRRTQSGISVAWEFSSPSDSRSTSTASKCLSDVLQGGESIAELQSRELHRRDELVEDAIRSLNPDSISSSTVARCLNKALQQRGLIAELPSGGRRQQDELIEDAIHYMPYIISEPILRRRTKSSPAVLFQSQRKHGAST